MKNYYVLVAGNGESSRANIECLLEDYFYSKGPNGVLVLEFHDRPSMGQIYAAQFAKDNNKDLVIFCGIHAEYASLPSATINVGGMPEAVKFLKGEDSVAFILWDDTDDASVGALTALSKASIGCKDLTNGLLNLEAVDTLVEPVEPVIPVAETIPEEEFEADEEDDLDFDESDIEDVIEDVVNQFAESLAGVLAQAVVDRLKSLGYMPKDAK